MDDDNNDGEADFETQGDRKIYKRFYCNSDAADGAKAQEDLINLGGKNYNLGVGCPYIQQESCQP